MAQHRHYWSIGPLADRIRGTKMPSAATGSEWNKWHREARAAHPFRYWIVHKSFKWAQDTITWPKRKIIDVLNYLINRYHTQTHALCSTLKKGQWHEFEERLLHSAFDELVNFVEIDLASNYAAWHDVDTKWYDLNWRSSELGLASLKWQMTLTIGDDMGVPSSDPKYGKPSKQAIAAKEMYELYTWWKVERPARIEPRLASGWSAHCATRLEDKLDGDSFSFLWDEADEATKKESRRIMKVMDALEKSQENEDTTMLIRLVKVRKSVWA